VFRNVVQVPLEFYAVVTRTLKPELSPRELRAFLPWSPIEITPGTMERAWHVESRYQLS
jgi:hypothetical protein